MTDLDITQVLGEQLNPNSQYSSGGSLIVISKFSVPIRAGFP